MWRPSLTGEMLQLMPREAEERWSGGSGLLNGLDVLKSGFPLRPITSRTLAKPANLLPQD